MKRIRWVISYNKRARKWYASQKGVANIAYRTQHQAIKATAAHCRKQWKEHNEPHEIKIKGRNGRIRDSRTYGNDPRRIKG